MKKNTAKANEPIYDSRNSDEPKIGKKIGKMILVWRCNTCGQTDGRHDEYCEIGASWMPEWFKRMNGQISKVWVDSVKTPI